MGETADTKRFEHATLAVSEVKCMEVGCPPLETLVLLLDESDPRSNSLRVQKPLLEVTEADVELAVARLMRGEQPSCNCGEMLWGELKKARVSAAEDEAAKLEALTTKLRSAPESTTREDIGLLINASMNGLA